jgi:hypothetical protein
VPYDQEVYAEEEGARRQARLTGLAPREAGAPSSALPRSRSLKDAASIDFTGEGSAQGQPHVAHGGRRCGSCVTLPLDWGLHARCWAVGGAKTLERRGHTAGWVSRAAVSAERAGLGDGFHHRCPVVAEYGRSSFCLHARRDTHQLGQYITLNALREARMHHLLLFVFGQ